MTPRVRGLLLIVGLSAAGLAALAVVVYSRPSAPETIPEASKPTQAAPKPTDPVESVVVIPEYRLPGDPGELPLVDDRLEDKKTEFDPAFVDRRPLEGWSLNLSEAVIKLDVPKIDPDYESDLLVLHPSYAAAIERRAHQVLPSINLIDGKAKQFDDGLYAAIDRAYYLGHGDSMKSHRETIRRIYDKVSKSSEAHDYLAAGLSLGQTPSPSLGARARAYRNDFLASEVLSKPIGFYTWRPELEDCFRLRRFFSRPLADPSIAAEIARILRDGPSLRADYARALSFYAGLTNPPASNSPNDFVDGTPADPSRPVALFPPSTSREAELFGKLFPNGVPADANLMRELIVAIRSGKVDLTPRPHSGWYDHQVYALETLLLPERGVEANKLLLTREYKKRMLDAFRALLTKHVETDVSYLGARTISDLVEVRPRLRVEPNPTYYLRTARSYAFLGEFLEATLGAPALRSLHGLTEKGERSPDLLAEVRSMRDLLYGFYLLSAEDIGLKPSFLDGEPVDREASEKRAGDWLAHFADDPDLAVDTRIAVPIYHDPRSGTVRLWMTVGVRLARLYASYARPPRARPLDGSADWEALKPNQLKIDAYAIPVDEFAEVEIQGGRVLDRAELRAICDRYRTKGEIVAAIAKGR